MDERGRGTMFCPLDPVRDPNPCVCSTRRRRHQVEDEWRSSVDLPCLLARLVCQIAINTSLFASTSLLFIATGTVLLPVNSRYWFTGIVGGSLRVLFVLGRLPPATEV